MRTETRTAPRREMVSDVIRIATGDRGKSWSDATRACPYVRMSIVHVTAAHSIYGGSRSERYHTSLVLHPEAAVRLAGIAEVRSWMVDHPSTPTFEIPGDAAYRRLPLTIAAYPILLDGCMIDGTGDDVADTCLVVRRESKREGMQVMLKLVRIFG